MPEVKARLHDAGAEPAPTSAEAFGQFITAELDKWGRVVKAGNITAD
jgi:tripartite-type tricarboxylate transporter receptor subunit TctC